jgi:DNA-binding TFAR19-related protein (PDSD5 family)
MYSLILSLLYAACQFLNAIRYRRLQEGKKKTNAQSSKGKENTATLQLIKDRSIFTTSMDPSALDDA